MLFKQKKRKALGLDIGTSGVKTVLLEIRDKELSCSEASILDLSEEGILDDEEELNSTIHDWLRRKGYLNLDICAGLPQYVTTAQIRDFPMAPASKMKQMVSYETRHLAGLSEEAFVNDYHIMEPKFGRTNPAFIGICRQSVISEKIDSLNAANVSIVGLTMNSVALANVLFHLNPKLKKADDPQVIVEIGVDNSTVLVIAGGQILYINSLIFGSDRYSKILTKELGVEESEAEQRKRALDISEAGENTPLYLVTQQLLTEVSTGIDVWRNHERPEVGGLSLAKIWLTGGGAKMKGLDALFAKQFGCETEVFGPVVEKDGAPRPELTVPYGLALYQLGLSEINITLCPEEIIWTHKRRVAFPYLVASAAMVMVIVAALLARYYLGLVSGEDKIDRELSNLQQCERLIQQLSENVESIQHNECVIIPFLERSNGAHRYVDVIRELSETPDSRVFYVYLGDENSFRSFRAEKVDARAPKPVASSLFMNISNPDSRPNPAAVSQPHAAAQPIDISDWPVMKSFVLMGFTICNSKREHYDLVRGIQKRLNESPLFRSADTKVDILSEDALTGREDITKDWMDKVANNRDRRRMQNGKYYRPFALILPFAKGAIVKLPPKKAEETAQTRRGGR